MNNKNTKRPYGLTPEEISIIACEDYNMTIGELRHHKRVMYVCLLLYNEYGDNKPSSLGEYLGVRISSLKPDYGVDRQYKRLLPKVSELYVKNIYKAKDYFKKLKEDITNIIPLGLHDKSKYTLLLEVDKKIKYLEDEINNQSVCE